MVRVCVIYHQNVKRALFYCFLPTLVFPIATLGQFSKKKSFVVRFQMPLFCLCVYVFFLSSSEGDCVTITVVKLQSELRTETATDERYFEQKCDKWKLLKLFTGILMRSPVLSFFPQVVIVGNGAVGKSSMIQRYCKGIFTRNYKKTIGVDFLEKHITWVDTKNSSEQMYFPCNSQLVRISNKIISKLQHTYRATVKRSRYLLVLLEVGTIRVPLKMEPAIISFPSFNFWESSDRTYKPTRTLQEECGDDSYRVSPPLLLLPTVTAEWRSSSSSFSPEVTHTQSPSPRFPEKEGGKKEEKEKKLIWRPTDATASSSFSVIFYRLRSSVPDCYWMLRAVEIPSVFFLFLSFRMESWLKRKHIKSLFFPTERERGIPVPLLSSPMQ